MSGAEGTEPVSLRVPRDLLERVDAAAAAHGASRTAVMLRLMRDGLRLWQAEAAGQGAEEVMRRVDRRVASLLALLNAALQDRMDPEFLELVERVRAEIARDG